MKMKIKMKKLSEDKKMTLKKKRPYTLFKTLSR